MTNKETLCSGCGATVTKTRDGKLSNGTWKDVSGNAYCEGIPVVQHYVVKDALPSTEKCSFSIGDTVRWMGQDGPKVGTVRKITHPENAGFVLWIGDGEMEDFPLVESQVSVALPPVAIAPEPQHTPAKHATLPWSYLSGEVDEIRDADGGRACMMHQLKGNHGLAGRREAGEVEGSAKLIVEAVNSHDDMLAALKAYDAEIVKLTDKQLIDNPGLMTAVINGRSIVSRAEGGKQ